MKKKTTFFLIFSFSIFFFCYGILLKEYKIFPFKYIKIVEDEITGFIKGHPADSRTIFKRFRAELLHNKNNYLAKKDPYFSEYKFKKFNNKNINTIDIKNFSYFSNLTKKNYFLISGSFLFNKSYWGVILIDTDGNLLRFWEFNKENYDSNSQHIGLAISKDGDIITNTHGVLRSVDWCNKLNWMADWKPLKERRGHDDIDSPDYHHDIKVLDEYIYTFKGQSVVKVNLSDGKIIEKIDLVDLIKNAAKQNIFIFDSRFYIYQNYDFENLKTSDLDIIKTPDPTHFNKVDVLDSKKASYFNLFLKGDYLISSRNLNLVFVYRPSTKKIIWYTVGRTSRQHDSTFQNGHIMVFDNNPYTSTGSSLVKFSENNPLNPIERINLKKKYGIHAEWRGNFEYYDDDNTLLVSNDDRGQIIYAKLDGNDKFIFNNGTDRKKNLITFASLKVEPEFIVNNEKKCK